MKRFVKIFENIVWVLTFTVVLFAGVFVVPKLFGLSPYVVLSASMEPAIETGSVLFTDTKHQEAVPGDVVTYQILLDGKEILVSHRVMEKQNGYYITKGDNNDTADIVPVAQNQIIGIYKFHIPKVGYLVSAFTPKVLMVVAVWIVLLNGMSLILAAVADKKDPETPEEEEKGSSPDDGSGLI